MRLGYTLLYCGMLASLHACGSDAPKPTLVGNGTGGSGDGTGGVSSGGSGPGGDVGQAGTFILTDDLECQQQTCAELGWACGYMLDRCGEVINCADEGLTCADNEICSGGIGSPTQCVAGGNSDCEVCDAIPDCSTAAQPTRLSGRVVSPGRTDGDTANQVGVPNAIVYILRGPSADVLPPISVGIPTGGTSCDRCEEQDLGPVLVGAVTDSSGNYTLEGRVPVDEDFVLVVKAGKFRRAQTYRLPSSAACTTTTAPAALTSDPSTSNPTRLPRSMSDGLAVNLPRVAVTTGQIDAMECVLEKMGIAHGEFSNPGTDGGSASRIHLYRGGSSAQPRGARINDDTPHDAALYGDLARMQSYDLVVSDCEGQSWDDDLTERDTHGARVREYVNRGGRLFASHLSMSWLHSNSTTAYSAGNPIATGLANAASWDTAYTATGNLDTSGTGIVSVGRADASPRIQSFADWMVNEGVTTSPAYTFNITDPRSLATSLGDHSEEFVHRSGGNNRVQQFSFNTPYGAPAADACGRVAYSGFHVATTGGGTNPFGSSVFPNHCAGNLTDQEKILLYMLFDLGACVGTPPEPPPCVPLECGALSCGFAPDGCGNVLDCGPCRPPA